MTSVSLSSRWVTTWRCYYRTPLRFSGSGKRHASTRRKIFRENDVVLLKQKHGQIISPILSKPLRAGSFITLERGRGSIAVDDVLGKRVRDIVRNAKGIEFRIREPTLGEYTDLSARLVTPIYSQDTNLIVSLLDLHPNNPGADNGGGHDTLEIFEAGTGHGALTLNLARAIHGANTAAPPIPQIKREYADIYAELQVKAIQETYDKWRANRRAVIHTLDQSRNYSKHAQKVVKDYRQGMYFPNVDFHVGSIEDFLEERSSAPFLDHAILDLPNTHHYFDSVGNALKANGSLVTWCPSITQITKCVTLVKEKRMPLLLDRVIEVGAGLSGGREWDVRMVMPRATSKAKSKLTEAATDNEGTQSDGMVPTEGIVPSLETASGFEESAAKDQGWEMVCRPKVGLRVIGGGFIALWRKMEQTVGEKEQLDEGPTTKDLQPSDGS